MARLYSLLEMPLSLKAPPTLYIFSSQGAVRQGPAALSLLLSCTRLTTSDLQDDSK